MEDGTSQRDSARAPDLLEENEPAGEDLVHIESLHEASPIDSPKTLELGELRCEPLLARLESGEAIRLTHDDS